MNRCARKSKGDGWNRSTGILPPATTRERGNWLGQLWPSFRATGIGRAGARGEAALARAAEAEEWLQRGQKLCFDRQFGEGLEALRKAASLDGRNPVIRAALLNALVEQARSVLGDDWRAAEPLIEEALNIDAGHPLAKSLQELVLDYKRKEILTECVSQAREMQANGDLERSAGQSGRGSGVVPERSEVGAASHDAAEFGGGVTCVAFAGGQTGCDNRVP